MSEENNKKQITSRMGWITPQENNQYRYTETVTDSSGKRVIVKDEQYSEISYNAAIASRESEISSFIKNINLNNSDSSFKNMVKTKDYLKENESKE